MTSTRTGLTGRVVVVTGGASGIGRAAALKFAAEHAKVLVADLNREGAEEVVREIETAGGAALAVAGDLSDQRVVDTVVERAVTDLGGLDVLANNAGIMDRMSALGETDDAEWERVMRVNLTAPFLLTRAALPHMLDAGRGSIVFTASEASLRGSAAGAAYTAAKHAVAGLVKSLAVTYREQGVRANAIAPGPTATSIRVDSSPEAQGPALIGRLIGATIGRMGSAEEQAAALVFLASDDAAFINGAILPVDDGWAAV
ncbi:MULTISPECIES: SDR family NAD(P)-dependent oxidoreductase [unclassified Streptomyces]|uniref:SDR family NAD(P)-dependent oxidoreductase n=1 Tax=unclassified Streptomyces TaxID=2593676 RepID=UPI002DD94435|nr:SDR family NAD(P)-dependent oxidoreductase [Streptomyces sp. NBC_01795]WSA90483.1 SDR family oxidoreductase [Streptomyces sp. NBC_01795]WSS45652.1 SDR family oxidoreductase [Streptomyces sp. NBC_01187]